MDLSKEFHPVPKPPKTEKKKPKPSTALLFETQSAAG